MKQYFIKNGDQIIYSNWPISENGQISTPFEVSEEDLAKVQTGDWKFNLEGETLTVVEDVEGKARREAEKQAQIDAELAKKARKKELMKKVVTGEATDEEQEEFLNL